MYFLFVSNDPAKFFVFIKSFFVLKGKLYFMVSAFIVLDVCCFFIYEEYGM